MKSTTSQRCAEAMRNLGGGLLAIAAGCTPASGTAVERSMPMEQPASPPATAPSQSNDATLGTNRGDDLKPIAVVELFTSEGCSSCPPADDVLRDLASAANGPAPQVITLSFHVDYWDDLGWPDPFSSARNTARQRAYAKAFGSSGLYTPQMIVGGTDQFVGSDRARAQLRVKEALSHQASAKVGLRASPLTGEGELEVRYTVEGAPDDAVLVVALVEGGIATQVRRGENAGHTLRHESVVRAFETVHLASPAGEGRTAGSIKLTAPRRTGSGERAIVGYVQNLELAVVGAARARLDGA